MDLVYEKIMYMFFDSLNEIQFKGLLNMKYDYLLRKITKGDYFLISIFFLLLISISIKIYFNTSGYLSPDSIDYLSLAQYLLDNNSFYMSGSNVKYESFAIWPVGYSSSIFLISKITGLTVFLVSKILNIALIALFLWSFRGEFKENAFLYALIFFFASFIQIYSYSWSESLFIFCLFWFSRSIHLLVMNLQTGSKVYLSILFSSLFMFLFRYIGSFSFGITGLLGLYYFFVKKERLRSFYLFAMTIFNLLFMSAYLYHNYLETGFYTGMIRSFDSQSSLELILMLVKSIVSIIMVFSNHVIWKDIAFPLFQFVIVFALVVKYKKNIFKEKTDRNMASFPLVFLIIGILYLILIASLSCTFYIEKLNYRLLAPGSFLIFIALINYFENYLLSRYFKVFKIILVSIAFYSWSINVPYQVFKDFKNPNPLKVNVFNSKYTFVK